MWDGMGLRGLVSWGVAGKVHDGGQPLWVALCDTGVLLQRCYILSVVGTEDTRRWLSRKIGSGMSPGSTS